MGAALGVLVDGRALTDSSAYRGIGTYVRNVLDGISRDGSLDVTVLCRSEAPLPERARRLTARRALPGRLQNAEHDLLLPLDLVRRRADVVWAPAMDAPRFVRTPWVQTLHDAWPAVDHRHAADTRAWRRFASRLPRATAVVAVSRWTADAAVAHLGLDARRLYVIPHGVAPVFQPLPGAHHGEPYLLLVGEYDPRKRHDHAYAVVAALADAGLPHRLKVTGRIAPWFEEQMRHLVDASPRPDRVDLLGHVPLEVLVELYQSAAVVIITSRAEGFGLPALEAMACGAPVVAYDNSALSEVVAGAGLLVPDGDVDAMTAAVLRVVREPALSEELSGRGLERARGHTWARSAADHATVLREAACG